MDPAMLASAAETSADLLFQSVPGIVLGILAAELLIALGVMGRVAIIARPLISFSHLRDECAGAFVMAFVSPTAANVMLVDYQGRGIIGKRELVLASLINSFPSVLMHWRVLLPVYIPLLGFAGLLYFAILTLVGFVKTGIVMVAARMLLPPVRDEDQGDGDGDGDDAPGHSGVKAILRETLRRAISPLKRILVVMIPTIFVVAVLMETGFFDLISSWVEGIAPFMPVPAEGLGIIAAHFAHSFAAASAAAPLYAKGLITTKDLLITLLIGSLLSSIPRTIRWYGTSYVGIFGPRVGTEVMLLSTGLRDGILAVVILVLVWLW
ncbi:MAG: nucleoside recognition protein [Methanomicrobiaceae archaeon]|nr:nucleoside recognition protein [Methanomicrobiaceae archaeon]